MVMDLIILGIFLLVVIVSIIRGFAMTLIGFAKGIAALVVSWIFCDDLAEYARLHTSIHSSVQNVVNGFLNARWEDSAIYEALPKLFKGDGNEIASSLISGGAEKIANVIVTVMCFLAIWLAIRLILGIFGLMFSKKHHDGAIRKTDTALGLVFGIVLGIVYVYLFLALIIPVVGFIIPNQSELVLSWFEGSHAAQWMYDNNLLLILLKNLLVIK